MPSRPVTWGPFAKRCPVGERAQGLRPSQELVLLFRRRSRAFARAGHISSVGSRHFARRRWRRSSKLRTTERNDRVRYGPGRCLGGRVRTLPCSRAHKRAAIRRHISGDQPWQTTQAKTSGSARTQCAIRHRAPASRRPIRAELAISSRNREQLDSRTRNPAAAANSSREAAAPSSSKTRPAATAINRRGSQEPWVNRLRVAAPAVPPVLARAATMAAAGSKANAMPVAATRRRRPDAPVSKAKAPTRAQWRIAVVPLDSHRVVNPVPIHRPVASPETSRAISLVAAASDRVDRRGAGALCPRSLQPPKGGGPSFAPGSSGSNHGPVARGPGRPRSRASGRRRAWGLPSKRRWRPPAALRSARLAVHVATALRRALFAAASAV